MNENLLVLHFAIDNSSKAGPYPAPAGYTLSANLLSGLFGFPHIAHVLHLYINILWEYSLWNVLISYFAFFTKIDNLVRILKLHFNNRVGRYQLLTRNIRQDAETFRYFQQNIKTQINIPPLFLL